MKERQIVNVAATIIEEIGSHLKPYNQEVSVVIPTAGRRPQQLHAAVHSVIKQSYSGTIRIIIVDDSVHGLDRTDLPSSTANRSIHFIQNYGSGSAARQTGTAEASGEWLAYLDDDDIWMPDKLERQIALAREMERVGAVPIVSCRMQHYFPQKDRVVRGVPQNLVGESRIAEYLFVKRPAKVTRPSIFTSTLLLRTEVGKKIEWRPIPRHQDWDWLLRAETLEGVKFAHCPEELVVITVGSTSSISASPDWHNSYMWAEDVLRPQHPRAYNDFLMSQCMRYALQARSLKGVRQVFCSIRETRLLPSIPATTTALAGVLPRRLLEGMMSLSRPRLRKIVRPFG